MQAAVETHISRLAALELGGARSFMADLGETIRRLWPALKNRVEVLEDRKRSLAMQLEDLETELRKARQEFEAIDLVAQKLNPNFSFNFEVDVEHRAYFAKPYKYGDVSIKQAARLTLSHFRDGLSSHDLFSRLNRRYFEDRLERTSFSPQLSRLKKEGEVVEGEQGWVLTDKGRDILAQGRDLPYQEPDTNEPPSA